MDEWIKGPIYDDDSNAIDGLGALDVHGSDPEGVVDVQDEPSPVRASVDFGQREMSTEGQMYPKANRVRSTRRSQF